MSTNARTERIGAVSNPNPGLDEALEIIQSNRNLRMEQARKKFDVEFNKLLKEIQDEFNVVFTFGMMVMGPVQVNITPGEDVVSNGDGLA